MTQIEILSTVIERKSMCQVMVKVLRLIHLSLTWTDMGSILPSLFPATEKQELFMTTDLHW